VKSRMRAARVAGALTLLLSSYAYTARPSASAASSVTIRLTTWDTPAPIQAAAMAYEATHANVSVQVTQIPYTQYLTRINTLQVSGSVPDIYELQEYNPPVYGAKGVLQPLDTFMKSDLTSSGLEPQALLKSGGKTWGIAGGLATMALYYNPSLFKKAGVTPPPTDPAHPWTWAQYVAAAKKLTVDTSGKHPGDAGFNASKIKVYGTNEQTSWLYLLPLVRSAGGGFYSSDGKTFTLTSAASEKALQAVADLSLVDHVAPSASLSSSFPAAATMLINGQMAMDYDGTWNLATFSAAKFTPGIAAIPMFSKPQNSVWGAAYVISKNSKNPAVAWDVIHSILATATFYKEGGNLPIFKSWYTNPKNIALWANPAVQPPGFMPMVRGTVNNPTIGVLGENVWVKNFGQMMDNFVTPGLDGVWSGHSTVAAATTSVSKQVQSLLAGAWQ
jgi:multiple sugar transport system substrate-binding protein